MRKVILNVALSLDGYIEGSNGEYDWCFTDQDYGMKAFSKQIDALFCGRRSYQLMAEMEEDFFPRAKKYIFSKTISSGRSGEVFLGGDLKKEVEQIKSQRGKDIWLFGGASLIESFLREKLIDELWLAIHPILLGSGKPLFANLNERIPWQYLDVRNYSTGLVIVKYGSLNQK